MVEVSHQVLERLLRGELEEADSNELLIQIDADPELRAQFNALALESLVEPTSLPLPRLDGEKNSATTKLVAETLNQIQAMEIWSVYQGGCELSRQQPPPGEELPLVVRRCVAKVDDWASFEEIPVAATRDTDGKLIYLTGLPQDYRMTELCVSRFEQFVRDDLVVEASFKHLEEPVYRKKRHSMGSTASPLPTDIALAADTSLGATSFSNESFRAEIDLANGECFLSSTLPLDKEDDYVVAELAYRTRSRKPSMMMMPLRIRPNRKSRRWSRVVRFFVPALADLADSKVTIRFRSLRGEDAHLFSHAKSAELLRPGVSIPAREAGDGYRLSAPSVRHAVDVSNPVCWSLGMIAKDPDDDV